MRNKTKNMIKLVSVAFLAAIIIGLLLQSPWDYDIERGKTSTRDIGELMFGHYGIAFLAISFILFSSLLGGIFLAKEKEKEIVLIAEYGEDYKEELGDEIEDVSEADTGGEP